MSFIVGILTFILVLICLFLILLVLVQLPKKDAGAGIAFGGGAADALFGAGSGNALTKITKYTTIAFLVLSLILGLLQNKLHPANSGTEFSRMVEQRQQQGAMAPPAQQNAPTPAPAAGNNLLSTMVPTATNAPAPAPTPAPVPAATNAPK